MTEPERPPAESYPQWDALDREIDRLRFGAAAGGRGCGCGGAPVGIGVMIAMLAFVAFAAINRVRRG